MGSLWQEYLDLCKRLSEPTEEQKKLREWERTNPNPYIRRQAPIPGDTLSARVGRGYRHWRRKR